MENEMGKVIMVLMWHLLNSTCLMSVEFGQINCIEKSNFSAKIFFSQFGPKNPNNIFAEVPAGFIAC